jgi:hypothetical protein
MNKMNRMISADRQAILLILYILSKKRSTFRRTTPTGAGNQAAAANPMSEYPGASETETACSLAPNPQEITELTENRILLSR